MGRLLKRATFPEPPVAPFPGAAVSGGVGVGSTVDAALVVPTVWACTSLIANAVSMLPLETFRRTSGIPARVDDPPVVTSPAAGMTQSEWLHMMMMSFLLRGNVFGQIVGRDKLARPTQIELLNPDAVRVSTDAQTGQLAYWINGVRQPAGSIWHVRGMTIPGTKVGLSPIAYAAAALGVDVASRKFAADFFAGSGIPKAVAYSDQHINQDQARTIKDRILAATVNRDPIVLGAGLKYQAIQVSPEEAQFLATQQASVSQIARYFSLPAEMVGGSSGNSLTYSSHEQRGLEFLTFTLTFWLKRIEDAIFPLLPQPEFVKFDTSALLRTDAETQAKVDNQQLAGKIRTPTEIRAKYGWAPMTDDQKAEVNMVPLDINPNGGVKALPAMALPGGAPAALTPADAQAQQ